MTISQKLIALEGLAGAIKDNASDQETYSEMADAYQDIVSVYRTASALLEYYGEDDK